ncbi:helix-turn-helix domain-containing protein [Halogeometricum sp. S1BR25-6]|uniref:Helix-turn-helix domain-containing protein n=1 Tax=Halogeometricum salsisoli TaxID=2950536 RepID=A0ABU2GFX2_9EURY|nr:helix-turn-helix domain-containing protein [Halogeometricum sp. S1BR25-6]MDS0299701.1 helix-turn-helix domain-containing protein [Halogeometricum sp. S1BR25-6]
MVVIVHFLVDAGDFVLGRVTQGGPEMHVELERVVPTTGRAMPFFWAFGTEFEAFERSVRRSDGVEELRALAHVDGRALYRVRWMETTPSLTAAIAARDATVLEAAGGRTWSFRVRFPDHHGLAAFHEDCRARGVDLRVERVATLDAECASEYGFDLTPKQSEALSLAVESGYFEVPRQVTLSEVADRLGISQQAASERVRRAADAVLRRALLSRVGNDR